MWEREGESGRDGGEGKAKKVVARMCAYFPVARKAPKAPEDINPSDTSAPAPAPARAPLRPHPPYIIEQLAPAGASERMAFTAKTAASEFIVHAAVRNCSNLVVSWPACLPACLLASQPASQPRNQLTSSSSPSPRPNNKLKVCGALTEPQNLAFC